MRKLWALWFLIGGLASGRAAAVLAHDHDPDAGYRDEDGDDDDGGDWFSRGYELHQDGHYDRAIAAFEKAIEAGHREEIAMYNIACGYALKGDPDRAFAWLDRALATGFEPGGILGHDDDLDSLRADPRFAALKKKALAAEADRHRADAARAMERLERLEQSGSRRGGRWFDLGQELHGYAAYAGAARAWQRAVELGYREGTASYNVACALALAGEGRAALDWLDRGVEAGFAEPEHMRQDDDLDSIRGEARFADIVRKAEALELPPLDSWSRKKFWSEAGWRAARERYQGYLESNPRSGHGWSNLGHAELVLGQPGKALAAFQRALELGYRKDVTTYNVACAYARLGDADHAIEWLRKVGDGDPDLRRQAAHDDDLESLRDDPRFRELVRGGEREWREKRREKDEKGER